MNPQPRSNWLKTAWNKTIDLYKAKRLNQRIKTVENVKNTYSWRFTTTEVKYIYCSFKLGTYPLEDSGWINMNTSHYVLAGDRVVEIIEMVERMKRSAEHTWQPFER